MATLEAELGCGRHLASTVVTGSGQWSSTLLAELRLSTILVLALRAFHCGPRRKKRARCTARVTSRMVDASHSSRGGRAAVKSSRALRSPAAPPSSVMNLRRLMPNMGPPPPPYPAGSGHQRARALQVGLPQV